MYNPKEIKHIVLDGHSLTLESFVAVARYLMVDVEHIDALYIAYLSGAILILVLSLWVVRKSEKH